MSAKVGYRGKAQTTPLATGRKERAKTIRDRVQEWLSANALKLWNTIHRID